MQSGGKVSPKGNTRGSAALRSPRSGPFSVNESNPAAVRGAVLTPAAIFIARMAITLWASSPNCATSNHDFKNNIHYCAAGDQSGQLHFVPRRKLDELLRRAPSNWYIEAQEALALGLIRGVL
jgi:hypothetical protein